MNRLLGFLFFLGLSSIVCSEEKFDSHLPRPLILEFPETHESQLKGLEDDELRLQCSSWRFAAEANNLNSWSTIPPECAEYVKDYMTSRAYTFDLERVSIEATTYARSLQLVGDGMDAWVFDIDETLLSNLPYYIDHGFGLEVFDGREFDKWVEKATASAIESSSKLYEEVLGLGFKVFLLTGRSEKHRSVTVENLRNAGFQYWDKLILRALEDHGKTATLYKSERRSEMVKEGYRILGNSGDQWSDLLGYTMSIRSFKLPNPMYYIP
ncbi:acid phosphatase 1-like [Macadamia integrifolia]|uniref:acid phosphatase 1-like n=1 Tax=Macadamia integrifolia TaxID=60698 RepID=UPI001C4EBB70|nr:acid phosphatase 1-like [Macadamia integrifolia]